MERKFLAARKDLVEGVAKIAKDKHLTLFALANEALEQTLRADVFKRSLREVVDEYETMTVARGTGHVILAEGLLYPLIERCYGEDEERLEKAWYSQGAWYGTILPAQFMGRNPTEAVENFMRTILWGISDFVFSKGPNGLTVRCIGSRLSASYTSLLAAFLEGMMHALGYATVRKDVSRGIILLTLKEKGAQRSPLASSPKEML